MKMQIRNTKNNYGIVTKLLHWTVLILFAAQYYLIFRRKYFPDNLPAKTQYILLHKSIGVTLLAIGLLFLLWAIINIKPIYPSLMKKWEINLAKTTKYALYLILLLMPISGFIMSQASGRAILWFGISIPQLINKHEGLSDVAYLFHVYLGITAIGIISLHILGALKHFFTPKNHIAQRMLALK